MVQVATDRATLTADRDFVRARWDAVVVAGTFGLVWRVEAIIPPP